MTTSTAASDTIWISVVAIAKPSVRKLENAPAVFWRAR